MGPMVFALACHIFQEATRSRLNTSCQMTRVLMHVASTPRHKQHKLADSL